MTQIDTGEPVLGVAVARVVDVAMEVLPVAKVWDANVRVRAMQKPREWSEVLTTRSGEFVVQVVMPNGTIVELTRLVLTVEPDRVGVVSVRTAAGQRAEPKPTSVE